MSQVGPLGVTPRPRPVVLGVRTGTVLPSTTVVPETWDWNGSVWAMWSAYSGAHRHTTTTISRTTAAAVAGLLCDRSETAVRQGPGERRAPMVSDGAVAPLT